MCVLLGLALFLGNLNIQVRGPIQAAIVVGIINIVMLCLGRWLIHGRVGAYSVAIAGLLNLVALGVVLVGLNKFGFADDIRINAMIWAWMIFPVVTLPTLIFNRIEPIA